MNEGHVLAKYINLGSLENLKAYVYIMRKSNFKESFYKGSLRRISFATLQIYYRYTVVHEGTKGQIKSL